MSNNDNLWQNLKTKSYVMSLNSNKYVNVRINGLYVNYIIDRIFNYFIHIIKIWYNYENYPCKNMHEADFR